MTQAASPARGVPSAAASFKRRCLVALLGLLACVALPATLAPHRASAQGTQEDAAGVQGPDSLAAGAAAEGEHLTVYLMTMGPGRLVWERFGHNAIWIADAREGSDLAYNYGIFDFDQVGFYGRLVRGDMLYSMEAHDARLTVEAYRGNDRSVWIQELELTGAQKVALQEFLVWNARPENANYNYDYYRDNCSTRVRDALDRALGGQLAAALQARATSESYRSESQRLSAADVPAYTGLLLAMGHPADAPLTAWEVSFVPMRLAEYLREVTVLNEAGERVPLVGQERTLYESTLAPPPATQPEWLGWFLAVGLVVGILIALVGRFLGESRTARAAFGAGATLWLLAVGVLGTAILLLWGLTEHVDTYWNENLLQFNPLALVLAGLLPLAVFGRSWASRAAAWTAGLAALLSVAGLLLQLVPGFDQPNGEIIALVLPAWLALAWVLAGWHGVQGERRQLQRVARRRR